jgi:subtilisin-like proprotein convertase family protein
VAVSGGQTAAVNFTVTPEPPPAGLTATRFPRLNPVLLKDADVTRDSVKVPQSLQVKGLSVFVDVAHQYIGDLKISLTSPSGLTVILVSYAGFGGNLIETTFTQQKVPSLSRFVGENAAGTWTLTVVDNAEEDVGTLRRWWVTVLSPSGTAGLKSDFNGDGKVDFDDFFMFADAFGRKRGEAGYDAKFDLDGGGTVDFNDFFMFADDFGKRL